MDDAEPLYTEKLVTLRSVASWRHPTVRLEALSMPGGLRRPIKATLRRGRFRAFVDLPMTSMREEVYRRLTDTADELAEVHERMERKSRLIYDS